MWRAYSLVLKKYITADECNYSDTTRLQIKCPYCYQPVMLRKGNYISSYFAHYSTTKSYTLGGLNQDDCPNRTETGFSYSYPIDEFFNLHGQNLITQFAHFSQFFDDFIHYDSDPNISVDNFVIEKVKRQIDFIASEGNTIAQELLTPQMKKFYDLTLLHFLQKTNATTLRAGSYFPLGENNFLGWESSAYIKCLQTLSECYANKKFNFSFEGKMIRDILFVSSKMLVPSVDMNESFNEICKEFSEEESLCILGLFYQQNDTVAKTKIKEIARYGKQLLEIYKSIDVNKIIKKFDSEILVRNVNFFVMMLRKSKFLKIIDLTDLTEEEKVFARKCMNLPYGKNIPVIKLDDTFSLDIGEINKNKILQYLRLSGRKINFIDDKDEKIKISRYVSYSKKTETKIKSKIRAYEICPYCEKTIRKSRLKAHMEQRCDKRPKRQSEKADTSRKNKITICFLCKNRYDNNCSITKERIKYMSHCLFFKT